MTDKDNGDARAAGLETSWDAVANILTVRPQQQVAVPAQFTVTNLGDPLITVSTVLAGVTTPVIGPVTLSSLIGAGGIALPGTLSGLIGLTLGGQPRALRGAAGTVPATAPDGTSASGAVDLLRLRLLGDDPPLVDVGLFHMEGAVSVPAGGLKCQIPVSKVASIDPVTVGQELEDPDPSGVPQRPEEVVRGEEDHPRLGDRAAVGHQHLPVAAGGEEYGHGHGVCRIHVQPRAHQPRDK